MTSGEVIRLSVGLIACLEAEDCRPSKCDNSPSRVRRRSPRGLHEVANVTSELSFVVVVPLLPDAEASSGDEKVVVCVVAAFGVVILACMVVLVLVKKLRAEKGL